jgi:hypothetical protein
VSMDQMDPETALRFEGLLVDSRTNIDTAENILRGLL